MLKKSWPDGASAPYYFDDRSIVLSLWRCPSRRPSIASSSDTENRRETDYELAQASASGEMWAFERLYERHSRRVYSLCLRMTQNAAEAEDLAQEVFIQLFRKLGSFRGESQFTTWLHRLTVNQVLMHFRKKGVRLEQTTDDGDMPVQVGGDGRPSANACGTYRFRLHSKLLPATGRLRAARCEGQARGSARCSAARGTSKSQLHKARMKRGRCSSRKGRLAPDRGLSSGDQATKRARRFEIRGGRVIPPLLFFSPSIFSTMRG